MSVYEKEKPIYETSKITYQGNNFRTTIPKRIAKILNLKEHQIIAWVGFGERRFFVMKLEEILDREKINKLQNTSEKERETL